MSVNHIIRSSSCVRAFLWMNIGACLVLILRVYVLPSVTKTEVEANHAESVSRHLLEVHPQKNCCNCTSTDSESHRSSFKVPNIVHYIWYNKQTAPLQFHHLLSILSAHKILKPDIIYFHTDKLPGGVYWERVKRLPDFKINYRSPPQQLFGEALKPPMFYTSHSNVDRVKILQEYGGVYLDLDTIIIKPLDDLRNYDCTIGLEQETQACGSFIMCNKNAMFLILWLNAYLDDYQIEHWAYNSGKVPANLARRYPQLVHVEPYKINRPNFDELDRIWGPNRFNWQDNYALHLWYRIWKDMSPYYDGIEPDPNTIKTMNNTFGEIARTVYYGKAEMIL